MTKITTLFIDKGGVLVDNTVLGAQYRRLLGEYLPTELGGTPDAWAKANVRAFERAWARYLQASGSGLSTNIREWYADDDRLWLYDMCDEVGVPRPPASQTERIASAAHAYVRQHVDFPIPRIVGRLRDFHDRGLTLHLASGDQHEGLVQYLGTLGARELFDRVHGTDLLNVWKSSAIYYRAILADTRVDPSSALVIDDSERAIGWAGECGLGGVVVSREEGEAFEAAVLRAFDTVGEMLA